MGCLTQYIYLSRQAASVDGPVLEIGSKNYGTTQDLRPLFAHCGEYVGIDMEAGDAVDVVLDMTDDFSRIDAALAGKRFGAVICVSVLEHCAQPFRMAENITRLLRPGGRAYISAPFAWKFHGYPSDYWRFTHEGIKQLFPGLDFAPSECMFSSYKYGGLTPIDTELGKIPMSPGPHRQQGHPLRAISAGLLQLGSKLGPLRWLTRHRYVMAPTNVYMMGVLKPGAGAAKAA